MKDFIRKRFWSLLIVAELLILGCFAGNWLLSERYAESFSAVGDKPIPTSEYGIALDRGYYVIDVEYATDENGIYCQAVADASYGKVYGEKAPLIKERTHREIEFEVKEATENFYIYMDWEMYSKVTLSSVTIIESARSGLKDCFLAFCAFLLLDILLLLYKGGCVRETYRGAKADVCWNVYRWCVCVGTAFCQLFDATP